MSASYGSFQSVHVDMSPSDISGLKSSFSSGEELQYNDQRLQQAVNYIAGEGGDDMPETFINRVNRLDELLIQQLPQTSSHFDRRLYRRLRSMVHATQREYEDAMGYSSLIDTGDDHSVSVSEEEEVELYTSAAVQALERALTPVEAPTIESGYAEKDGQEKRIEYRRKYQYGKKKGVENVEIWMRNYPAMLPFSETFRMAAWESMDINFDLSEQGDELKAKGVHETNVPWDSAPLQSFRRVDGYESGSCFKLPKLIDEAEDTITRGLAANLESLVDSFNRGPSRREGDWAPHAALRPMIVTQDNILFGVRASINRSPSKTLDKSKISHLTTLAGLELLKAPCSFAACPPVVSILPDERPPRVTQTTKSVKARTTALRKVGKDVDRAIKESPQRQSPIMGDGSSAMKSAAKAKIPVKQVKSRSVHGEAAPVSEKVLGKRKGVDPPTVAPQSKRKVFKVSSKPNVDINDNIQVEAAGQSKVSPKPKAPALSAAPVTTETVEAAQKVRVRVSGSPSRFVKRVTQERYDEYMAEVHAKQGKTDFKRATTRSGRAFSKT